MRCRFRPSLVPAPTTMPDDDDILREILLRLPPLPSSLPRASLVSKRWLRLISDPGFLRRFRAFHCRQPPPLLGIFQEDFFCPIFTPMLDPPDRIPTARLYLPLPRDERWDFRCCRHGLALFFNHTHLEATVWDPVTGDQRRVAFPSGFGNEDNDFVRNAAVLCGDGHAGCHRSRSFKLILLRADDVLLDPNARAFASFYDSETDVWSGLISASIKALIHMLRPSILVGNSICWLLHGYGKSGILEFDLDRQSLAEISTPVGAHTSKLQILRMENNGLGIATLSDLSMQVWERKVSSVSIATWILQKTIQLDKLLSLRSPEERAQAVILGYDEDGHAMFIRTTIGVFMIKLKSMEFKNLFETNVLTTYHPYRTFYTTGNSSPLLA
ncbi:unnamed protein product [Urochloa decumbens]|uniref:F-box domain-containing protein n=1 Tax=Urochloa decumbens TaxID=240449 RepID=A0ABC9DB69_9POAL